MAVCPDGAPWTVTAAISIGTFVVGLLIPRFWMSKKDSSDVDQKKYENSAKLVEDQKAAYDAYANSLIEYNAGRTKPLFLAAAKAGDNYFRQSKLTCDAILSDKVDHQHRDNTLVPHFERMAETTLPAHYAFMQREAKVHGQDYRGELRRSDHQSLYAVVEKHGTGNVAKDLLQGPQINEGEVD